MPLGFDSTSAYGARLVGQDPIHINYNLPAPYNTRLKPGLPPTPIDNPGSASMRAAISPARGQLDLLRQRGQGRPPVLHPRQQGLRPGVAKCKTQHWGCI